MNCQPFVCKQAPLEHFNQRKYPVEMLVIHSMAHTAAEGIARLDELKLSSHYVVDFDGTVFQCIDENDRAWHAGVSTWRGLDDLNSRSVGIEVCHRSLGQSRFNRRQIKSLINLCRNIIDRWHIAPDMIVGHSDIAPRRKPDPGKAFPWKELAAENIGIWYGSRFSDEKDIAKMLSSIGYDTSEPETLRASAYAFCRRFLPSETVTMPVRRLLDHPCPDDCSELLNKPAFVRALQNIYMQYLLYKSH